MNPEPKTLHSMIAVFSEKSFAVVFLVLMFFPALPLPTGGLTHLFEVIVMLLAIELAIGRQTIWLPKRWQRIHIERFARRTISDRTIKRLEWLEQFSRPRLKHLYGNQFFISLIAVCVFILALTAFVVPPFTELDTLPSIGAELLALSLLFDDFILFLVGIIVGGMGVVLAVALGEAVYRLL